ncbi:MAG: metallopeptidase family protein, partial [Planctomycetes bacterium]|nr:metallopeptidase family protein [Planctomycetota bacterium]
GGLYGLYEGTPFGSRGPDYNMAMPDRITIFKRAIERDCRTRADMVKCIQETVLHELGHYFGLDDSQLDELGYG